MSTQWLAVTPRLQAGITVLNLVEPSRLRLILNRIATNIQQSHRQQMSAVFTDEEEAKLEGSLGLSAQDVQLVVETCSYILHQAAFHVIKPDSLTQQLLSLDLEQERTSVIVSVWSSSARHIVDSLRQRSVLSHQLSDTSWQLHLETSSENSSRTKIPHGILQLTLANGDSKENVNVDMDAGRLRNFYRDLERIQAQLDSLK